MEVRNCKGCGRLFNYMGAVRICPKCQNELENKFYEVKNYLRDNPNATIHQVAEEMDVSVKQIKQWIREERLSLSEATAEGIGCESCGTPIRSGRFCEKCKAQMQNALHSVLDVPKAEPVKKTERSGNKMRFLQ